MHVPITAGIHIAFSVVTSRTDKHGGKTCAIPEILSGSSWLQKSLSNIMRREQRAGHDVCRSKRSIFHHTGKLYMRRILWKNSSKNSELQFRDEAHWGFEKPIQPGPLQKMPSPPRFMWSVIIISPARPVHPKISPSSPDQSKRPKI